MTSRYLAPGAPRAVAGRISCLVALVFLMTGVGCGTPAPHGGPDGGVPVDADLVDAPVFGSVNLVLRADSDDEDFVVELATIGLRRARVRNDRGGDFEPTRMEDVGLIDLMAGGRSLSFPDATPATYGRASIDLDDDVWGAPFELRIATSEGVIRVVGASEIQLDLRCDAPVLLDGGDVIALDAHLDIDALFNDLSAPLPPPVDGVILVDSTSAPEVLLAIEAEFAGHWDFLCVDSATASALR